MVGKSSDVQIQIQIQIRPNLQIQIQIRSFKKAQIQIQIHRIWQKSANPDLNPNPGLDLPTIAKQEKYVHILLKCIFYLHNSRSLEFHWFEHGDRYQLYVGLSKEISATKAAPRYHS